ncbi:MAG TPA: UDP-2,3-diacylglucosamine diphosphatase [candidate division WOR-3 bacterium]|uniref:UDP-2,3-diacylglucosamine diphosphatase n=1 Tax=candidate division WOR-3 bacterium TaxID=2052148 RepID=A0A7C0ZEK9_UNCW3|nr:UDP-2,3-diacylglucosamine diphosphatase [candidate division WOR-3 bacterium]
MKGYRKVLLISDTHFPLKESTGLQAELVSFVREQMKSCDALFLLGDIFDFYHEYNHVIPKAFFPMYVLFKELRDKGKDVHYWTGNHDFWHGDFLKSIGVVVHRKEEMINLGGVNYLFAHGDETGRFNPVTLIIKSDINRFLFRHIHPDIGFEIARMVSRLSRISSSRKQPRIKKYIEFAHRKFREGADVVVIGHIHEQYTFREGEKLFVVLGDWMIHRYYGLIEDGRISLRRWNQSPE